MREARRAGAGSAAALLADLRGGDDLPIYRVRFHAVAEPDPRDELAADDDLTVEDVDRDRPSPRPPRPGRRPRGLDGDDAGADPRPTGGAGRDLAASVGRETAPFKLDVRKLKAMGLTISLEVRLPAVAPRRALPRASPWMTRARLTRVAAPRPLPVGRVARPPVARRPGRPPGIVFRRQSVATLSGMALGHRNPDSTSTEIADGPDTAAEPVFSITEAALAKVTEIRSAEDDPESLCLWIEVTGANGVDYTYDLSFESIADLEPTDHREPIGDLIVAIPAGSVDQLRGATLDLPAAAGQGGLVLRNPNRPNPLAGVRTSSSPATWPTRSPSCSSSRSTRRSPPTAGSPAWSASTAPGCSSRWAAAARAAR